MWKKARVLIEIPKPLKQLLDEKRKEGFTITGYIRSLLEREIVTPAKRRAK